MPSTLRYIFGLTLAFCALFVQSPARAHSPGQALLSLKLQESGVSGTFSIYYGDLPLLIDGLPFQVPEPETDLFTTTEQRLLAYLNEHIQFSTDGGKAYLPLVFRPPLTIDNQNNALLSIRIDRAQALSLRTLTIGQSGFYKYNPRFTTLVNLATPTGMRSVILSKSDSRTDLFLDPWAEALSFIRHGFEHILSGPDHIFFVLLLIFSPFISAGRAAAEDWRRSAWTLLKLATAFTVAHSLTLCLAVLKLFWMPAGLVDILIIFSIVFVGLHNLVGFSIRREWLIVFAFGLFHGYGFSSALQNAGLSRDHLWLPLISFNIGVELGQVVVIAIVFPAVYLAARRWQQTSRVVWWSTAVITFIAGLWLLEKLLGR